MSNYIETVKKILLENIEQKNESTKVKNDNIINETNKSIFHMN